MTTSDIPADQAWGKLADLEGEQREATMLQRYGDLEQLPARKRRTQMLAMARAEYGLSDEKLRAFTISKLRVWLRLDPMVARRIVASYDDAMQKMSTDQAMRRVALVQTLAREFSPEDQRALVSMVPGVFGGAVIGLPVAKIRQAPRSARQATQSMSFVQLYFSFEGRINRSTYWLKWVLPEILIYAFLFYVTFASLNVAPLVIGILILVWPHLAIEVKRWHDLNKSAWWILIWFIPIIGPFWALIELGLEEGTGGRNQFGPEPG